MTTPSESLGSVLLGYCLPWHDQCLWTGTTYEGNSRIVLGWPAAPVCPGLSVLKLGLSWANWGQEYLLLVLAFWLSSSPGPGSGVLPSSTAHGGVRTPKMMTPMTISSRGELSWDGVYPRPHGLVAQRIPGTAGTSVPLTRLGGHREEQKQESEWVKIINGSILPSSCPVFPVGKTNGWQNGWGHNFPRLRLTQWIYLQSLGF